VKYIVEGKGGGFISPLEAFTKGAKQLTIQIKPRSISPSMFSEARLEKEKEA